MANIIDAIINLVENPKTELYRATTSTNRANIMGEALEEYVKDLFAGTVEAPNDQKRLEKLSEIFSYLGQQSNPPDIMLKGGDNGDAIEVKKIETRGSQLALNSSYPKNKLYADSTLINNECRTCETWKKRDMFYIVGVVDKETKKLNSLAFVCGDDYCADKEIYEKIRKTIKEGVESIPGVEFAESKELGHVNRVDPLGITYLRVRGMWGIENPFTVYNYIYSQNQKVAFNFMCVMNTKKFESLPNHKELYKTAEKHKQLKIEDVKIKNPNNPAKLKEAKLITFYVEA